ncbi:fatty acid synthase-like protein [Dinothrombium tinctorium]|uniref:Fatty acid synthase-like protein n=1 Tax=Dinothrombium tinctorium TaxID=1965070 RepID=A0A3S3Q7X4_9ACAR|nr:fatty acid synthase-like protein [Dinothrombium tinctorium]RWS04990.1 fatty acid synthase-like protein [Dinothrombium tinctorium]
MTILSRNTRALFLPVRFQCVRCDPRVLLSEVEQNPELPVAFDYRINVCATKGLEIKGVRCNIAPRRTGAQLAVLEKYDFIPYNEECALTNADKQEIEEYIQVTSTVTRKLLEANGRSGAEFMNGFKDASEDQIKRYLDADPTDFALLHTVNDIKSYDNVKDFEEKVQKGLMRHRRELPKDILANVYLRERILRPSLDVVAENSSKFLNVLEVNASPLTMSQTVKNFLELSGASVNYTLAHPSPADLGNSVSKDISVTEWNFLKSSAPSELNNIDLVLYKDISTYSTTANGVDLQALLNSMYTITKTNGFVLAFLRHGLTGPERFLYDTNKQSAGKRVEEFKSKALEIGFSLVAQKADGMSSTTLLLRKATDKKAEDQTLLPVSSEKFEWVEELKNALKECAKKPEGHNLWLIANDKPTNGIIGFVNCLRQEPNGDRIRCIFNLGTSKINIDFRKSPFTEQYGEKVQAVSEEQQHTEALVLLLTQYVSIDYAKTKSDLLEIHDIEARNIRATEIYLDNKGPRCEPEAIAFAAQAFYQKVKMLHGYKTSKKFDGNVFLIRAEELLMKNVDDTPVLQDYGISEVITGECTVRTFKGNHKTFIVNNLKAIASILNDKLC